MHSSFPRFDEGGDVGRAAVRARKSRATVHTACLLAATTLSGTAPLATALLSPASSAAAARFAETKSSRSRHLVQRRLRNYSVPLPGCLLLLSTKQSRFTRGFKSL